MAPCLAFSLEECIERYGLENNLEDAKVLCGFDKEKLWQEQVSASTAAIFIYLFTNLYVQIAESSLLLQRSDIWGKGGPREIEGRRALRQASLLHCTMGLLLYPATGILVGYLSSPLDRRTRSIVTGISQLFGCIVLCMMSFSVPQWFGLYHSTKKEKVSYASERAIRFSIAWNLWKQLLSMFFFHLYFSSPLDIAAKQSNLSVLYGAIIGMVVGTIIVAVCMKARRPEWKQHAKKICIGFVGVLSVGSVWLMYTGVEYILEVWMPTTSLKHLRGISWGVALAWGFIGIGGMHILMMRYSKASASAGKLKRFESQLFNHSTSMFASVSRGGSRSSDANRIGNEMDYDDDGESGKKEEDVEAEEEDMETRPRSEKREKKERSVAFADNGGDDDGNKQNRPSGANSDGSRYIPPEEALSYWRLFLMKLAATYPYFCKCLQEKHSVENISRRRLDYVSDGGRKTKTEKAFEGIRRFVWYFLSFAFVFLTVVNIAASYQQCYAKNMLSDTFAELYPPNYLTGPMCAWDTQDRKNTIKTFESLQDVKNANYTVIHCGRCGACSNWNDIGLQFTTTEVLAAITKTCAQKSIGNVKKVSYYLDNPPDIEDPVVQCNYLQVGFTPECSAAWAWDEVHTKNHAVFSYIQAQFANSFADMSVTYADITQATIDESVSGPLFVPWVGATRRRMNIASDIKRPAYQQCTVAEENWEELFAGPNDFYTPKGGTYTILPKKKGDVAYSRQVIGQDSNLIIPAGAAGGCQQREE